MKPYYRSPEADDMIFNILFDLDGTLSDPKEGICNGIRFALKQLNQQIPPESEFASFVGPPLRVVFAKLIDPNSDDLIEKAVSLYRQNYRQSGLKQHILYHGVPEMLQNLKKAGYNLFVATSKPIPFAKPIVDQLGIKSYFKGIYGSELDGKNDNKVDLIADLLNKENLRPEHTMMVGDREHDIIGAKKNGLTAMGVTYGYGSERELLNAGADAIVNWPKEVASFLDY